MGFARFFARNFLGIRSETLPWAQDVWKALEQGGALSVTEADVREQFGLLDMERSEARQLRNDRLSLFHLKSYLQGSLRETLDILVTTEKRGGMAVYFTDGNPVSWKRPSSLGRHKVSDQEKYWYVKILDEVRKVP